MNLTLDLLNECGIEVIKSTNVCEYSLLQVELQF